MSSGKLKRLKLGEEGARKVISVACVMCLVALGLIVWSLFSKTVLAVMVAMSFAQGIGTLSLALFLWAVVSDLLRARVLGEKQDE